MNIKKVFFTLLLFAVLALPSFTHASSIWDDIWDNTSISVNVSIGNANSYGLPDGSILGIIENILTWLLGVISMVSVIGFIIAGIMYLTAAGDDGQIEKAKNAMKYSIIGTIVGISGIVVTQAAAYMLSAQTF